MSAALPPPTSDWKVFRLLWQMARRRAAGRAKRQRELMRRKKGNSSDSAGGWMSLLAVLGACIVHVMLGWMVVHVADVANRVELERSGLLILGNYEASLLDRYEAKQSATAALQRQSNSSAAPSPALQTNLRRAEKERDQEREWFVRQAAQWRRRELGGTEEEQRRLVADQLRAHGRAGFASRKTTLRAMLAGAGRAPTVLIPLVGGMLVWWFGMLVLQGEGLELDVQRRRHPMWEWLLSHPVRPAAAFYAELLAPMVSNPVYLAAPIFWCVVFSSLYGFWLGVLGAALIGVPLAVAASCINKALEISALLRLSTRSRGAVLGFMSWLGYVAMVVPFFSLQMKSLWPHIARFLLPLRDWMPAWPVRALTVGWTETPLLFLAIVCNWLLAAGLITGALWLARNATRAGLQAPQGNSPTGSIVTKKLPASLGRNPLYRKELLWLIRDKGAVIQAILIPVTIGAVQAFNLRGLYNMVAGHWNAFCGLALLCGSYMLLVLGPRSLNSEGSALWLALTWPRGLEDLLKAKARLWWIVANIIVGLLLVVAVAMYPADAWRIALVAVGWYFFSHSLALKSVTLVTAPSSSGEPEPPKHGRQWIAMLGTFAFGTGVITQSWHIAIIGVVFSYLMAATMWQNLRARLPYLFDAWSEKLPPAPSLMHASVGILVMVECIGLFAGIARGIGGVEYFWLTRAIAYGVVGLLALISMQTFLAGRGVTAKAIWLWPQGKLTPHWATSLAIGVAAGALLGLAGRGYMELMAWLPWTSGFVAEQARLAATYQNQWGWLFLLAVGFAPLAEEYFFRGLLYRALDREWGGWSAMALSSAYFAIYHPPLAWVPVAGLGLLNAFLFKRTGCLAACVLCHMAYNAIVLLR
ncbi:MAG: CPBP family intramembrane metalloprotease [Opitutae bacterium]|nr:CPBP family intramembrane metalloprotease [Opitutae bacterium]